jgi:thiazole synthase ThiGH ThiG subunit
VVDNLKIGSHIYSSRLIVGTGKYTSEDIASKAINSSGLN